MNARNETAALDVAAYRAALAALRNLLAEHIAEALTKAETAEHHRVVRLCRGLDEAGLNLDDLVEGGLRSYDVSPEEAWQSPSARRQAGAAPDYDPWAVAESPAPAVLPEPVRQVLVEQLALMRTDDKTDEVRVRAVHMAAELACAGVNLYAAVDERAQELKPGTPSLRDEPPF